MAQLRLQFPVGNYDGLGLRPPQLSTEMPGEAACPVLCSADPFLSLNLVIGKQLWSICVAVLEGKHGSFFSGYIDVAE